MNKLATWLTTLGFIVAIGCALAGLAAGLGYRFDLWHFRTGIATLGYVFWVAAATAVVTLVGLVLAIVRRVPNRAMVMGFVGVVIAGITAYVPYHLRQTAGSVPAIHDITTDLANPPAFVRATADRKKDDHPVAYDGPKVGEMQKAAYPDIATIVTPAPADKALEAAKATLSEMGLEITDTDPAQGRVEAMATSMLFGFKDDVIVRVATAPDGTHVDVRSKSRVGRNDFGMNAKRIRTFAAKLRTRLG
jgi:uncharacterized protein (DUF1499 family)